ncbi:hypothetical protein DAPPUDRAFT_303583 [Daphnia pulex]|nr:hypothetical protein DAPPUDRAFT_303583 [Daphnia pulex]|eukprot:EFX65543.1 hypothetical protein DAPPUDRAFT_303583 [Daphnia pulex]
MFQHGMGLTVKLMKTVQEQREKENSVPAKLESNKENLRKNFMMVSNGVAKTITLFASNMADILEEYIKFQVQKSIRRHAPALNCSFPNIDGEGKMFRNHLREPIKKWQQSRTTVKESRRSKPDKKFASNLKDIVEPELSEKFFNPDRTE